jgi:hypothetical protein
MRMKRQRAGGGSLTTAQKPPRSVTAFDEVVEVDRRDDVGVHVAVVAGREHLVECPR